MNDKPRVAHIFIAPEKGAPMQELQEVLAIKGRGLNGDRHASWWKEGRREITLIAAEAIEAVNRECGAGFLPFDTRRNIVIAGISPDELNDLAGKKFRIGSVVVEGTVLCVPCTGPSKTSGKKDFRKRFQNRGGLCVKILQSDFIEVGDELVAIES